MPAPLTSRGNALMRSQATPAQMNALARKRRDRAFYDYEDQQMAEIERYGRPLSDFERAIGPTREDMVQNALTETLLGGGIGTAIGAPVQAGAGMLASIGGAMPRNALAAGRHATPVNQLTGGRTISTRMPTAVRATEDPMTHGVHIGPEQILGPDDMRKRAAQLVRHHPGMNRARRSDLGVLEDSIEHQRENLNYVYENTPPEIRERSKQWYVGANTIANQRARQWQLQPEATSAVYAALSPQKDWFQNVALGDRLLDIYHTKGDHPFDSGMANVLGQIDARLKSPAARRAVQAVQGKRLHDLEDPIERALWIRLFDEANNSRQYQIVSPEGEFMEVATNANGQPSKVAWGNLNEMGNAVSVLQDPSLENISRSMGQAHKVRSFFNNIVAPNSPGGFGTIDTHAVAAGHLLPIGGKAPEVLQNFGSGVPTTAPGFQPWMGAPKNSLVTGTQGLYGLNLGALQRAAADQGVIPREMQSITWEAVRGLFANKSPAMQRQARDIWDQYRRGRISQRDAQDQIVEAAGGWKQPAWAQ